MKYDNDYKIMVVSDILKENGKKYDCYEDMYQGSIDTYNEWEIWDKKNKPNTRATKELIFI